MCITEKKKKKVSGLFSSLSHAFSLTLSRTPAPNPVLHKGRCTRRKLSNKVGKEKRKKRGPEGSLYELFFCSKKNKKRIDLRVVCFILRTFSVKMGRGFVHVHLQWYLVHITKAKPERTDRKKTQKEERKIRLSLLCGL